MPKTVDDEPNAKFRRRDAERAKPAAQDERQSDTIAIDREHHAKANAPRQNHARMRISAPDDLQKPVGHTAEQHFQQGCRNAIITKSAAKRHRAVRKNAHVSSPFPFLLC